VVVIEAPFTVCVVEFCVLSVDAGECKNDFILIAVIHSLNFFCDKF